MHEQIEEAIVGGQRLMRECNVGRGESIVVSLVFSVYIDGLHCPPIFNAENVRSAKTLKPRPDDIFVCSYPKSGTTWIQHIVHQLLGKTEYEVVDDNNENGNQAELSNCEKRDNYKSMCDISPMIEEAGADFYDATESPRVLKSHFTYANIPKGGGAKYIYTCRNPKDCLTSCFHHHRNIIEYEFENGDFDLFFELFMDGQVDFNDYFDHLTSWLDGIEKGDEQILLLKYEDMIADHQSTVVKIATFLGGNAAELIRKEQQLAKIVQASTIDAMKVNQQRWFPEDIQRGNFIRKGVSRDWKNHFSREQSERMDTRFQRCGYTVAAKWWEREMAWNEKLSVPRRIQRL